MMRLEELVDRSMEKTREQEIDIQQEKKNVEENKCQGKERRGKSGEDKGNLAGSISGSNGASLVPVRQVTHTKLCACTRSYGTHI